MAPIGPLREAERGNWAFFQTLPDTPLHDRAKTERNLPFKTSRISSCCGRCLNSQALAPAVARRPI